MHDQQCGKLSENKLKFCNHTFHHQVVQEFYQSDGSEDVSLGAFVEIQTVDYKLVYCLQIIYVNGYTLSFQGLYQCYIIEK